MHRRSLAASGLDRARRRLVKVVATVPFRDVADLAALLPPGLPDPFTTADLAVGLWRLIASPSRWPAACAASMSSSQSASGTTPSIPARLMSEGRGGRRPRRGGWRTSRRPARPCTSASIGISSTACEPVAGKDLAEVGRVQVWRGDRRRAGPRGRRQGGPCRSDGGTTAPRRRSDERHDVRGAGGPGRHRRAGGQRSKEPQRLDQQTAGTSGADAQPVTTLTSLISSWLLELPASRNACRGLWSQPPTCRLRRVRDVPQASRCSFARAPRRDRMQIEATVTGKRRTAIHRMHQVSCLPALAAATAGPQAPAPRRARRAGSIGSSALGQRHPRRQRRQALSATCPPERTCGRGVSRGRGSH